MRRAWFAALIVFALGSCSDDTASTTATDAAVTDTPSAVDSQSPVADTALADVPFGPEVAPPDVPTGDAAPPDVSVEDTPPDVAADLGATDAMPADVPVLDVPPADVSDVTASDVADTVDAPDVAELPDVADISDTSSTFDTFLSDCEELGIAPTWLGTFTGVLAYDLVTAVPPFNTDPGSYDVSGELGFDIACIDSKLIVTGVMDGFAIVPDNEETFPFTSTLQGTYDPLNMTINVAMVDGAVSLLGVIEFYFEGSFSGDLVTTDGGDRFVGTWEGVSTGTNQEFITGDADGTGTWETFPVPAD